MTNNELKTTSLAQLIQLLHKADNQDQKNIIAFEITCRIYVPFSDVSFDELLIKMGYKPTKEIKNDKVLFLVQTLMT